MDELDKKQLENLVDKIMDENTLERAPKDFTKNLMTQVELQSQQKTMEYKPIVSKNVLRGIVIFSLVALYLISTYAMTGGEGWFGKIGIGSHFDSLWDWFEFSPPSKITLYAVLFFGVMFFVQIPLLKKHIERQNIA